MKQIYMVLIIGFLFIFKPTIIAIVNQADKKPIENKAYVIKIYVEKVFATKQYYALNNASKIKQIDDNICICMDSICDKDNRLINIIIINIY